VTPYAFANIAASTTDAILVQPQPSRTIRVLGVLVLAGATATQVTFNSKGAGAGTAISLTIACAANGGIVLPENSNGWFQTNPGEALSVTTGSGSTTGVQIVWGLV
jgi:hypothetical protein